MRHSARVAEAQNIASQLRSLLSSTPGEEAGEHNAKDCPETGYPRTQCLHCIDSTKDQP